MKSSVSEDEFKRIKFALRLSKNIGALSKRFNRSFATITRINTAKNYDNYKELVRAEHPPINKSTLGERLKALEEWKQGIDQWFKESGKQPWGKENDCNG